MSATTPPRPPETVSIKQAAERLDVHENTIRNWVDRHVLAGYKTPTGRRKVLLADVERLEREMYGVPVAPQELSATIQAPAQTGRLERAQL